MFIVTVMTPDRPGSSTPRLIALDWGTTSMRSWLLGAGGRILDTRRDGEGLLELAAGTETADSAVRARAYEATYREICGPWLRNHPELPALACGMVGSTHGWSEAGYLTVPARLDHLAGQLTEIVLDHGSVRLIPGLRVPSDAHHDRPGDVLRGEETQIIGVLDLIGRPAGEHLLILPGTHTKWVRTAGDTVHSFTTAMTGELFGLVTRYGLLSHTASTASPDDVAFSRGLTAGYAAADRGLAAALFGARALVLDGLLEPSAVPDYVSGIVIADEVGHLLPRYAGAERVVLCGTADLCRRYAAALDMRGVRAEIVDENATAAGVWSIAVAAGLVEQIAVSDDTAPNHRYGSTAP